MRQLAILSLYDQPSTFALFCLIVQSQLAFSRAGEYTMKPAAADKRMQPRWVPHSNVSVFEHHSKEYLGLMVDCSSDGMMISTYDALPAGTRIQLDLIDIPPQVDSRRTGHCEIEVVWSDKISPSLYGTGCKIHQPDDMLHTMIDSYRS